MAAYVLEFMVPGEEEAEEEEERERERERALIDNQDVTECL